MTIRGGLGYNEISLNSDAKNNLIETSDNAYERITGFNADDTLRFGSGTDTYFTYKSGNDVIIKVGARTITLVGAASLSTVNGHTKQIPYGRQCNNAQRR